MWDMKANAEGRLFYEIQDEEGAIIWTVYLENLEPEEKLFIEMFEGERRQS